ncbi:Alpha-1,4 glucan phosphorylase [Paramicrosporidium saccamoebae]|uniref:Alpha-1,4 glucan phosphorylase n=1 Tax=Paramicrosporidium saccamoebae TaxID=1246581 RepID=A0A2H9TQW0_9FUNG|nr:Alpha-1,4 glucan phosphorylase [Paramicrosporidium saccamoebae]
MPPVTEDSAQEELRTFHHTRNKTGIVGGHQKSWSDDAAVNALWTKLCANKGSDVSTVQQSFVQHVQSTLARTYFNIDNFAGYQAAAHSLITHWDETQQHHTKLDVKRVYYLSLEFLMGRSLGNAVLNMGLQGTFSEALKQLGFSLEDVIDEERDAALGNGGLGRLAACFMDSLATLDYPAWGYGLRYTYGIFQQKILNGYQVEVPDYWLSFGNPWEVERLDVSYSVRFYGQVAKGKDASGKSSYSWHGGEEVEAVAYDVPIPGFGTKSTINIRLWSSKPLRSCYFDLHSFNEGNYQKSVELQQRAEQITSVLYPNDNTMAGKELRLKQQYFFVSATLQDIIRRFKKSKRAWSEFPNQVAIQLNDTHPTLGIPELMRILVDLEGLEWDESWDIVTKVYSFTNHTVLPEAMEKWPVSMISNLLPRHMQIIYDINLFFLQKVEALFPGDRARLARMSIIEESPYQQVRMAFLAVIGSHTVNGVAAIHSNLIKSTIFSDFVEFYGASKFQNKTNGITPRRWLHQANPKLSALISEKLGGQGWLTQLDKLEGLIKFADDENFQKAWMDVKKQNKIRLAELIRDTCKVIINPEAMYDVQVKRIHEYKRQFMNILSVVHRYLDLKRMSPAEIKETVPRVVIFGGKAAPGYYIAKMVIKLINSVAEVVFIPDYNISNAEVIIPASDISEHISTAGTEASGTSNMKFVLNGGLIIGTMDGANIEIAEEIGQDKMFIFGCLAEQVDDARHNQKYRKTSMNPDLEGVLDALKAGRFGDFENFAPLVDTLTIGGDYYLISHDFASCTYAAYRDKKQWARNSIISAAKMGKFSSDRSIRELDLPSHDPDARQSRPAVWPLPVDPLSVATLPRPPVPTPSSPDTSGPPNADPPAIPLQLTFRQTSNGEGDGQSDGRHGESGV